MITLRRIYTTWWPLAASWLLMGLEGPAQSAAISRLADPTTNLAAFGGIVFPLSMIIESPIIMLLSASTALSKDWASFQRIRRFMMTAGMLLTTLHILIAFTPIFDFLVKGVIGAPGEVIEPARIGLRIMVPWSWSIAYRRFHQGVLIRFGYSRAVGQGTLVRLSANLIVLMTGLWIGKLPGIAVAASAVSLGVVSEACFIGILARPVLKNELKSAPVIEPALSWKDFFAFYIPLALTSLISLLANPIGSAALSRMPSAVDSLAVWSVVTNLVFMVRSLGIAFNEVVVALLDEIGSFQRLRQFSMILAITATGCLLLVATTPLSRLWFGQLVAIPAELLPLAMLALWLALPLPALAVFQSWYQGNILHSHRTRGITESVIVYLLSNGIVLLLGVIWQQVIGLYIGLAGLTLGNLAQAAWLWLRARPAMQAVDRRDQEHVAIMKKNLAIFLRSKKI